MSIITMILYIIPTLILVVGAIWTVSSLLMNFFNKDEEPIMDADTKIYAEMEKEIFTSCEKKGNREIDKINCFLDGLFKNIPKKQFIKLSGIGNFSLSFYRKGFVLVEKVEQIDKVIQNLTIKQIENIDFKVFIAEMQKANGKELSRS